MKVKILCVALLMLLFTGCNDYKSIDECKQMKFKGIVIEKESPNPSVYCSNGSMIIINSEKQIITNNGLVSQFYVTAKPYREYHRIYIDFEKGIQELKEIKEHNQN